MLRFHDEGCRPVPFARPRGRPPGTRHERLRRRPSTGTDRHGRARESPGRLAGTDHRHASDQPHRTASGRADPQSPHRHLDPCARRCLRRPRPATGRPSTTGSRPRQRAPRVRLAGVDPKLLRIGAVAAAGLLMIPIALALRDTPADGMRTRPLAAPRRPSRSRSLRRRRAPTTVADHGDGPAGARARLRGAEPRPAGRASGAACGGERKPACAGTYTVILNDYWNRFPRSSGASVAEWLAANNATADTPAVRRRRAVHPRRREGTRTRRRAPRRRSPDDHRPAADAGARARRPHRARSRAAVTTPAADRATVRLSPR